MIDPKPPIRRATVADAAALAAFINIAGEGMPLYFWRQIARDGEDPWEIGRRRQAERVGDSTAFVIDEGGGAVACRSAIRSRRCRNLLAMTSRISSGP